MGTTARATSTPQDLVVVATAPATTMKVPQTGASPEISSAKKRILVVDDERTIVQLLRINLERQGHEVDSAFDAAGALEKLRATAFDGVILDLMMPEKDGDKLLQLVFEGGQGGVQVGA